MLCQKYLRSCSHCIVSGLLKAVYLLRGESCLCVSGICNPWCWGDRSAELVGEKRSTSCDINKGKHTQRDWTFCWCWLPKERRRRGGGLSLCVCLLICEHLMDLWVMCVCVCCLCFSYSMCVCAWCQQSQSAPLKVAFLLMLCLCPSSSFPKQLGFRKERLTSAGGWQTPTLNTTEDSWSGVDQWVSAHAETGGEKKKCFFDVCALSEGSSRRWEGRWQVTGGGPKSGLKLGLHSYSSMWCLYLTGLEVGLRGKTISFLFLPCLIFAVLCLSCVVCVSS